jgi:uncharacterized protein (TIGR02569 family)
MRHPVEEQRRASQKCFDTAASSAYRATMPSEPPPLSVLRAFGVEDSPRPLSGGQGTSWVAGDLVFKPGGGPVHAWLGEALVDVMPDRVRIAPPVRTLHGSWACAGWSATRWVDGRHPDLSATSTWVRILEAGREFHRAVAHLPRPACVDARQDWWAIADRAVWGEQAFRFRPELAATARRVTAALEPLGSPQVVHGDLTGNVLFHPTLAPAVIDISPYWRPLAYAEGVVVADALCWHGANAGLLVQAGVSVPAVARALLFRMATTNERVGSGPPTADLLLEAERYAFAAAAIGL